MNWRRILLMNLLNRRQKFDSDACHLMLKDTDQCYYQRIFPVHNQLIMSSSRKWMPVRLIKKSGMPKIQLTIVAGAMAFALLLLLR